MSERDGRGHRGVGLIVGVGIVVLLAVGIVVADVSLRAYAQDRARSEIEAALPSTVTGDVSVQIGGFSFLQQYLAGRFDTVTLDAPSLVVDGSPVAVSVTAGGVPTDLAQPVDRLTATLALDQDAVNSFVTVPGSATLTLDDQAVGYDGSVSFLGLGIDYLVTAGVSVTADSVVLAPKTATLANGSSVVDLSTPLQAVLDQPIPVCIANQLPRGVELTGLDVTPGRAMVTASATDFVLDKTSLSTTGVCP
ncbi:DUF2993 domain-containing protein [Agreia sp. COWG]|uniref:LmeA family phospholipid-binding protein n=1 Tax=Agreia sp. COWG TaxID=2773266 RepID=UPI0019275795|nr:DUF2993 domain-containing protein [Agreia sp. COWG]CAD6000506.1 conserved protein of unknown function [Agreia sp. COWG]